MVSTRALGARKAQSSEGDGFLESLARWFEDETRDEDEEAESRGLKRKA